jgi:hypothetical protein
LGDGTIVPVAAVLAAFTEKEAAQPGRTKGKQQDSMMMSALLPHVPN